jgi:LuxR family maltose regulon positive regulatory protein
MTAPEAAGTNRAPPHSLVAIIRRGYLFARLNSELEKRLVLIRAQPGCGKSELLMLVWRSLRRRGQRVAWVTLQPGWKQSDVIAAISEALGVFPDTLPDLLTASSGGTPVTLIFDEAESLGSEAAAIDWLVGFLSEGVRIAIAGRQLPSLRLSRLRMRGLLAEFGQADLAFGRGEMYQIFGQRLRPEEFDRATETLAGWPALVQLAAQILDREERPAARAMVLDGTHPILRDFVLEEVLPTLDPVEIGVLRACRDLFDFSLEIVSDLAGLSHTSKVLGVVEGMPPLMLAHEQRNGWFRRHPVVAAAMDATVDEDPTARMDRLRRASELFAERGHLEQAVLYASMAEDFDLAVRTIETAGGANLFLRAGFLVLQDILRAVPHDIVRVTPSLRLCRAVVMARHDRTPVRAVQYL